MPKSSEIAIELRKLADSLDKNPDAEIVAGRVSFYHSKYGTPAKESFLALAPLMPRPLKKGDGWQHSEFTLTHENAALEVYATIDKSQTCELVEPAKPAVYRCDPILSLAEEDEVLA